MKYIALVLLAACHDPDPVCVDALDREVQIENTLARVKAELSDVHTLAMESQRTSTCPAAGPIPSPCKVDDMELTKALYRADVCERDLNSLQAQAKEVVRAFKDPNTSWADAEDKLLGMDPNPETR